MLAAQAPGDFGRDATEHLVGGVDHEPVAFDFMRLGGKSFHELETASRKRARLYVTPQTVSNQADASSKDQFAKKKRNSVESRLIHQKEEGGGDKFQH